jgi:hypothetical protein
MLRFLQFPIKTTPMFSATVLWYDRDKKVAKTIYARKGQESPTAEVVGDSQLHNRIEPKSIP